MLRRCVSVAVVVFLSAILTSAILTSPAAAQGTVATIIGRVTDQSGAVLPGVTVTATSPALQVGQMTAVTNEVGEYRLSPLPVGVYAVAFELSGFQSARRQEIRLEIGFTGRIDVQLGVGAVAETVTVSGAAPVVDVTASSASTVLTREVLDLSPTTRNNLMGLLTLAPGVRTFTEVGGGTMMLENPNPRAHGIGRLDVVHPRRDCGPHDQSVRVVGLFSNGRSAHSDRWGCGTADARRPDHRRREVRGK
jgi:hypothetical protein